MSSQATKIATAQPQTAPVQQSSYATPAGEGGGESASPSSNGGGLSEAQMQMRSRGIGASEIGALLGVDPYRRPIDIYMRKLGLVQERQNFHTRRGQFLEPALRAWLADEMRMTIYGPCETKSIDSPGGACKIIATPDGLSAGDLYTVELKAPNWRTAQHWGEGDDAPDQYVAQVAQQMLVFGASVGILAGLVDGALRVYRFERDRELEATIAEAIDNFWRRHILTQTPPNPDGSSQYSEYVRSRFPSSGGELLPMGADAENVFVRLVQLKERLKSCEAETEKAEQEIKTMIADHDGFDGPLGKVTWRQVKGRTGVNWEAIARELGATEALVAKHTKQGNGYRRLLVQPAK